MMDNIKKMISENEAKNISGYIDNKWFYPQIQLLENTATRSSHRNFCKEEGALKVLLKNLNFLPFAALEINRDILKDSNKEYSLNNAIHGSIQHQEFRYPFSIGDQNLIDNNLPKAVKFDVLDSDTINDLADKNFTFTKSDKVNYFSSYNSEKYSVKEEYLSDVVKLHPLVSFSLNIIQYDNYKENEEFFKNIINLYSSLEDKIFTDEYFLTQPISYIYCNIFGIKSYLFSKYGANWEQGISEIEFKISDMMNKLNSNDSGLSFVAVSSPSPRSSLVFSAHSDDSNSFKDFIYQNKEGAHFVASAIEIEGSKQYKYDTLNRAEIAIKSVFKTYPEFSPTLTFRMGDEGTPNKIITDYINSMSNSSARILKEVTKYSIDDCCPNILLI